MKTASWPVRFKKQWVEGWYQPPAWWQYGLLPLSWIFQILSRLRYGYYYLKGPTRLPVPVIIVGNISVGGTGKTPLVATIAHFLKKHGWEPGIVTRGVGGNIPAHVVTLVTPISCARQVGDEAVLLARQTDCPVSIGRNRPQAGAYLLQYFPEVNILLCDDGLQHYALARDLEIAVIEGQRRLGNGWCLPAGPLRENPRRLKKVDFIVTNNGPTLEKEWPMQVKLGEWLYQVDYPEQKKPLQQLAGKKVHAVAAIGYPEKFFTMLRNRGIDVIEHAFEDHYQFLEKDLTFDDDLPIVMTEKDAVKCHMLLPKGWYIPLEVTLSPFFMSNLLRRIQNGQKVT